MDSMGLTRYMSVLMDDAMKQARFFDHEFVMPEQTASVIAPPVCLLPGFAGGRRG